MTTAFDELEVQMRVLLGDRANIVEHVARQEGVVDGAEQQRRDPHSRQPADRARSRVVILRVGKAVKRRGDRVVERIQRPQSVEPRCRDPLGKCRLLDGGLAAQGAQKAGLIHAGKSAVDVSR
jgi:hypothetical protein